MNKTSEETDMTSEINDKGKAVREKKKEKDYVLKSNRGSLYTYHTKNVGCPAKWLWKLFQKNSVRICENCGNEISLDMSVLTKKERNGLVAFFERLIEEGVLQPPESEEEEEGAPEPSELEE
jgi:hypothetical protein